MNAKNSENQNINRILIAMDNSPASLASVEAAAELAAGFGAELIGLFVEDQNLVRVAELSFTQEVGIFSGTSRRLQARQVEWHFRGQAQQAQRALEQIAAEAGVEWSFRVARGLIVNELLAVAVEADLIVLGRVGWSLVGRRRLGSTARSILLQGTQLTLLLQHGARLGQPVLVIYDGSTTAQKALGAAAQLFPVSDGPLTVMVVAREVERSENLQQEIVSGWGDRQPDLRFIRQPIFTAREVARFINNQGFGLVVVPNAGTLTRQEVLILIDEIESPVLLVR